MESSNGTVRTIGRMARESGLSVSALRFYDGAGVLIPANVDPGTGYRYYAPDQVVVARLVASLRRVGMPLAGIREVLAHRHDPARRRRPARPAPAPPGAGPGRRPPRALLCPFADRAGGSRARYHRHRPRPRAGRRIARRPVRRRLRPGLPGAVRGAVRRDAGDASRSSRRTATGSRRPSCPSSACTVRGWSPSSRPILSTGSLGRKPSRSQWRAARSAWRQATRWSTAS